MHWRRKWQPTPVFLPGESQGRGSLVGCRLWGHTESDTTEATQQQQQQQQSHPELVLSSAAYQPLFLSCSFIFQSSPSCAQSCFLCWTSAFHSLLLDICFRVLHTKSFLSWSSEDRRSSPINHSQAPPPHFSSPCPSAAPLPGRS